MGDEVAEVGGGNGGTERKWEKTITKTRERRGRVGAGERDDGRARGGDDRLMPTSMSIRATCAKPRAPLRNVVVRQANALTSP